VTNREVVIYLYKKMVITTITYYVV
jgi:hypothetical protein